MKYTVYMEGDLEAVDILVVNEEFWGDKCPVPLGKCDVEDLLCHSVLVE